MGCVGLILTTAFQWSGLKFLHFVNPRGEEEKNAHPCINGTYSTCLTAQSWRQCLQRACQRVTVYQTVSEALQHMDVVLKHATYGYRNYRHWPTTGMACRRTDAHCIMHNVIGIIKQWHSCTQCGNIMANSQDIKGPYGWKKTIWMKCIVR